MQLKPGTRLRSATDTTEVVVVRAPAEPVDVRCGGEPMVPFDDSPGTLLAIREGYGSGTLIGKRYAGDEAGIEILVTKAGEGSISLGETVLEPKGAKPLPSSD